MRRFTPTAAVLLASLLAGCGANPFPPQTIDFGQLQPDAPTAISMPLEEKVGQLFAVPANGVFMSEDSEQFRTLKHHVVDNRVGGVMLSRSSVYGAAVLVQKLQELARTPLLVSADLEAGSGMRFEDTTYGPWAMAVAATGDPSLAERRGKATAEEARAIGIGQVYRACRRRERESRQPRHQRPELRRGSGRRRALRRGDRPRPPVRAASSRR